MLKVWLQLPVLLMTGCLSIPTKDVPEGEFSWDNSKLYGLAEEGNTTWAEVRHQFLIDKNTCKIESLKVSIPSPSCTQAHIQDCSKLSGISVGLCQSQSRTPNCDFSSVNAAYDAQDEIFESCLAVKGWEKSWSHFDSIVGLESPTDRFSQEKIDQLVGGNPELSHWKSNVPFAWMSAIWWDEKLKGTRWKALSFKERLPLIVVETRNSLGFLVSESSGDEYREQFIILLASFPDFFFRAFDEDNNITEFGRVFTEISNGEKELPPLEHVEYSLRLTKERLAGSSR